MTNPTEQSMSSTCPDLSIAGAGRLGSALCCVWTQRGGRVILWSRRGRRHLPSDTRVKNVQWAQNVHELLRQRIILTALPGSALLECTRDIKIAKSFQGLVLSAAVDTRLALLQQIFPRATVCRFAPFLIDRFRSIPSLLLAPDESRDNGTLVEGILQPRCCC